MEQSESMSYLLRLWREDHGGSGWRGSLEDIDSHERKGFASLDELQEFLLQLTGQRPRAAGQPADRPHK